MPDVADEVRTLLLADATISGLVGTRVNTDFLPQGSAMPAIVLYTVSEVSHEMLGGIVGLDRARVSIHCFAESRGAANTLWDAVRLQLACYRGTPESLYIKAINQALGHEDTVDRVEVGTDQYRFVTSQDFFVWYEQTTA